MRDFKELKVWREAMELVKQVYLLFVHKFSSSELYVLSSQMRRAAISIPSNIAEGAGRNSSKEFRNFLGIASGSCFKLETQLIIAKELNYIRAEDFEVTNDRVDHIQKMIYKLQQTIND